MNSTTKKVVMASVMAALCCVATMIIKIPTPAKGYINLGDSIVLLSGFMLSPVYGFLSAAIGSAMADVLSGYAFYAPATFVVKGIMALVAHHGFRLLKRKIGDTAAKTISAIVAELVMITGYFLYEGIIYGFAMSVLNIPASAIQGIAGLIMGVLLAKAFEKNIQNRI